MQTYFYSWKEQSIIFKNILKMLYIKTLPSNRKLQEIDICQVGILADGKYDVSICQQVVQKPPQFQMGTSTFMTYKKYV